MQGTEYCILGSDLLKEKMKRESWYVGSESFNILRVLKRTKKYHCYRSLEPKRRRDRGAGKAMFRFDKWPEDIVAHRTPDFH